MGNVAHTPRLVDLRPGKQPVGDHAVSYAWDGSARTLGVTLGAGPHATISAIDAFNTGSWTEVRFKVEPSITAIEVERFNRLLVGLPGAPRLETYWRTKSLMLKGAGKRYNLPVEGYGRHLTAGGGSSWDWSAVGARGSRTTRASAPARSTVLPAKVAAGGAITAGQATVMAATRKSPSMPAGTVGSPGPFTAAAQIADREVAPGIEDRTPVVAPKPTPKSAPSGHLFKPVRISHKVYVGPGQDDVLERAFRRFKAGERMVIQLDGPTGSGKTLHAQALAERHGLPFLKLDVAGMNTFADWAGSVTLEDGDKGIVTRYTPSTFIEAISTESPDFGIPRVLLLDEVNRAAGTSAMNILLPALDHTGTIHIPDAKRTFHVDPAVLIVLTANIGSQYAGTVALDNALKTRVKVTLPVDYLPAADEAKAIVDQAPGCPVSVAEAFVKVATQTRAMVGSRTLDSAPVSTRQMVSAGRDVAVGATPLQAALSGWVNQYSAEGGASSERAMVLAATEGVLRGLNV